MRLRGTALWVCLLLVLAPLVAAQDEDYPEEFDLGTNQHLLDLCTVEETDEYYQLAAGLCLGFIGGVLTAHPDVHLGAASKKKSKSGAGRGAAQGAAAGAASGFMWGLITGGDPVERAAASAAVGATAGAVAGSFNKTTSKKPRVCLDEDATLLDAGQSFVLWAEKNKRYMDRDPWDGVVSSAAKRWPCK